MFPRNSISLVVSASRTDFKVLKDLNPEIRYLTEGAHTIFIPKGSKRGVYTLYKNRDLCKTHLFARFLRQTQILILEIHNVFLRLKLSPSLNSNKNMHFSKVSNIKVVKIACIFFRMAILI
jgi:hypothetical protein